MFQHMNIQMYYTHVSRIKTLKHFHLYGKRKRIRCDIKKNFSVIISVLFCWFLLFFVFVLSNLKLFLSCSYSIPSPFLFLNNTNSIEYCFLFPLHVFGVRNFVFLFYIIEKSRLRFKNKRATKKLNKVERKTWKYNSKQ